MAEACGGYFTGFGTNWGVRTVTHKYVEYDTGERQLFDLVADPYELTNLAGDPAHVVERIRNGFSGPDGYLVPLVLMLVCLSIVLTGAGTLSLDAFLAGRKAAD